MKHKLIAGFLIVVIFTTTSFAGAKTIEERVQRLEKILASIEDKLDRALPPIESKSDANPISKAPDGNVNKLPSATYDTGLWLEFYKIKSNNEDIPQTVNGLSLGVIEENNVSSLKYSSFRSNPSLDHYYRDYFGLLWSGAVEISRSGKHILGIDLVINSKHQFHSKCSSSLTLSGKQVAKVSGGLTYAHKKVFSDLKNFDLKEGLYPISVWLACKIGGQRYRVDSKLEGVSAVIKHRGPNGKIIGPIKTSKLVRRIN